MNSQELDWDESHYTVPNEIIVISYNNYQSYTVYGYLKNNN